MTHKDQHDGRAAAARPVGLRLEHHRRPFGIGESAPRVSWTTQTEVHGWRQGAYELFLELDGARGVSSGRIDSADQVLVQWPFPHLVSRDRGVLRVRVWSADGVGGAWSDPLAFEVGLRDRADWSAVVVETPWDEDVTVDNPPTCFRREFMLRAEPVRARLYVSAHGVVEARLNGTVLGDEALAPGWTSYRARLCYATHDVTAVLRAGANALGATVGDGWYRGRLAWGAGRRNVFGDRLGLLAQLEVEYADGGIERIATDAGWHAGTGAIVASSLYDGETVDARRAPTGWDLPGFEGSWRPVRCAPADAVRWEAPVAPPIVCVEELAPAAVWTSPSGAALLDFGRIVTGRLRIRVRGARGDVVTLRHAEVLQDGELCTRPLRTARATDSYTLRGEETEEWEPVFTMHGFRYAEIAGWPSGLPAAGEAVARVYRSDMTRTGWFECSDPDVTRLHDNVVRSVSGDFVGIPADCSQRDERLGWSGDAAIIAPSASFFYDTSAFYDSWLTDLAIDQRANGTVPMVVPDVPLDAFPDEHPVVAWGDAAVLVPCTLRERFGDEGVVRRQAGSMAAWARVSAGAALDPRSAPTGFQFGDWLDPSAPPEHPEDTRTDVRLIAFAYGVRVCDALTGMLDGDAAGEFRLLADRLREAMDSRFVSPDGLLVSDSQTAYALALRFDALLPERRRGAARRLAEVVERDRRRLSTGFLGAAAICDALVEAGRADLAYALLLQRDLPSWLYPVLQGATTVWERWDSLLPDGTVNPGDMTSFNHFSLGAVADWLHRTVAGLAPAEPGYRTVSIRPRPGGGLTHASARLLSPYGEIEVAWHREGDLLRLSASVPPNCAAEVELPGWSEPMRVGAGRHEFTGAFPAAEPGAPAAG